MRIEVENSPSILIVEDVEEIRDATELLLKRDGYRVEAARNEQDAVERARRRRPDLILVCLGGAPNDVIAAAHRVRASANLDDGVAVVVFCVMAVEEGEEVAIGPNAYVTRPDNFNQMRALIGRLTDNFITVK